MQFSPLALLGAAMLALSSCITPGGSPPPFESNLSFVMHLHG